VLLHSLQQDFRAVRRNVKVPNVKFVREIRQLALSAGLEIKEPQILVLNLSLQQHKSTVLRVEKLGHIVRNETDQLAQAVVVRLFPAGQSPRIDVSPAPGNCRFDPIG
jgi:hypothetical protein